MAGSYLKSLQLQKQLEERAKEAAKNRELAEKEYEALEEVIKTCKENDVDLSAVEKPRQEYQAAMNAKDYQTAIAHARNAREAAERAYLNKVGEVGDSVEALLILIQSAGGEAAQAKETLERSKERAASGDLDSAMKLAKSAYDSAERTLHEVFSNMFSQAQETIMQAKEMGNDVTVFENQLSKAKAALEGQDYEECMNAIREVLEGAGEDIRLQISSSIDRAEELVSAGEEFATDMTKVRNHIEKAKAALQGLRFKEALAYAKRAESEGENAISARLQEQIREARDEIKRIKSVKEDVSVPQEMLDQAQAALKGKKYIEALHSLNAAKEKARQIQFNSVLAVIAEARDRFVLAKKVGIDMTKAIALLNTARDHLKLGKFQEAVSYAEQSKKEVDTSLEKFYKARDQLAELAKAVKFAADMGADPVAAKSLLTQARKHFESKEYDAAVEATTRGVKEARKLARDKVAEVIDSSDRAVKIGRKVGADMTESEGTLQRAFECLSKEELAEAVQLARASQEASKTAITKIMSDRLDNMDQFVQGYSGTSSIDDVKELIAKSREKLAQSEFEAAYEVMEEIAQRIERIGQDECERLVTAARTKIEAIRNVGGDVSDLEILMNRAMDFLQRRVFEEASVQAMAISKQADETFSRMIQGEFASLRDALEEGKTIGIDIQEAREALKEARKKMDEGQFSDAFELLRKSNTELRVRIARYDTVKAKIRKAEELISEAGRAKADVTDLSRRLEDARERFVSGDLDSAEDALDKCLADAEKALAMYLAAKLILISKERIDLARANGINAEDAERLLAEAKESMRLKKYENALSAAKKCEETSKAMLSKSVSEMIVGLHRLLADAKSVGVDIVGPSKLAEKADQLARSGDFVEALKCVATAKEEIEHIRNLSSQAAMEIRVARSNLKDAETLDIDVGRAREFLDQAVEALTRHQYAIALELARKSSDVSMEVSKSRIWATLERFKEKVDACAAEGRPLGMAERCVADGIAAFKEGRYRDALKSAMACEAEMDRAELQRDISARAVELARRKMADASVEGIRSERLSELVRKAEALLAEGKYVEAMTAAIESGDELHRLQEETDALRVELGSVRESLERLRKIKIDTAECDEILAVAQDQMASHELEKARATLRRAAERAQQLFESSIKDVMEENRQMISRANSMGIDTKACQDLLEVANTSFREKLWDFAYQQAMACRQSCLEMIAEKMTALVEDVQKKIVRLQKIGAATASVEEIIERARAIGASGGAAEAFHLLMQADVRLGQIEDSHKKYMDILIAAESSIDSLGRFGLSKREPERLLAMAEIEKDKDYDSAIELVAEALDTAKSMMESYSPDLTATIASKGLQEGVEGELVVTVSNVGKALAKDIAIVLEGDFDTSGELRISALKPGTQEPVKVKIVPRKSGSLGVRVRMMTRRPFDGKPQTFEAEDAVNAFPAGPPFRLARATDVGRCIACQGRIKPGFDVLICRCGGQMHLPCAKRGGECPICGQKYSF